MHLEGRFTAAAVAPSAAAVEAAQYSTVTPGLHGSVLCPRHPIHPLHNISEAPQAAVEGEQLPGLWFPVDRPARVGKHVLREVLEALEAEHLRLRWRGRRQEAWTPRQGRAQINVVLEWRLSMPMRLQAYVSEYVCMPMQACTGTHVQVLPPCTLLPWRCGVRRG